MPLFTLPVFMLVLYISHMLPTFPLFFIIFYTGSFWLTFPYSFKLMPKIVVCFMHSIGWMPFNLETLSVQRCKLNNSPSNKIVNVFRIQLLQWRRSFEIRSVLENHWSSDFVQWRKFLYGCKPFKNRTLLRQLGFKLCYSHGINIVCFAIMHWIFFKPWSLLNFFLAGDCLGGLLMIPKLCLLVFR